MSMDQDMYVFDRLNYSKYCEMSNVIKLKHLNNKIIILIQLNCLK